MREAYDKSISLVNLMREACEEGIITGNEVKSFGKNTFLDISRRDTLCRVRGGLPPIYGYARHYYMPSVIRQFNTQEIGDFVKKNVIMHLRLTNPANGIYLSLTIINKGALITINPYQHSRERKTE